VNLGEIDSELIGRSLHKRAHVRAAAGQADLMLDFLSRIADFAAEGVANCG
jgi:hypothetical protein